MEGGSALPGGGGEQEEDATCAPGCMAGLGWGTEAQAWGGQSAGRGTKQTQQDSRRSRTARSGDGPRGGPRAEGLAAAVPAPGEKGRRGG